MSAMELIERLTGIVKEQADIIRAQADALAQVGASVMEEERADVGFSIATLIGWDKTPDNEALVSAQE